MLSSAPPRPRPSPPVLWQRARDLFAHLTGRFPLLTYLLQRPAFSRWERKQVRLTLEPVERLVRVLLYSRALTLLLMTGGMRTARPMPPSPPPQKPFPLLRVPMPGWRTLARPFDPSPAPQPRPRKPVDAMDPTTWRATFRVLTRRPVEPATAPTGRQTHSQPACLIRPGCTLSTPSSRPNARLVRRIEALRRVLANPERLIRRLAATLQHTPSDDLPVPPPLRRVSGTPIRDGLNEQIAAASHARALVQIFVDRTRQADLHSNMCY